MTEAFIYDHARTPRGRGRPDGALHEVTAVQLAAQVLGAVRDRNSLDTALVDDVILGCAQPVGEQGGNIGRAAVLTAGYAETVAGQQVHRFCASALEAVNNAAAQVMVGAADAAIGGGVESMSRVYMGADSGAWAADPSVAYDTYFAPQGIGADLIASIDGFSRTDVDSYAVESQRRAAEAWREGRFARSVVPVRDVLGDVLLDHDEHMRPGTTLEQLAALKPAFTALGEKAGFDLVGMQKYPELAAVNHVHTGGNSSGIVDGAAAVLVGSKAFGERAGLKPRARVRAFTSIGSEPTIMLTAPAEVTRKCLSRAGMNVSDIDLFELNEAFASVVLRFMARLELDHAKVNVNGGAIAMGHPLGATGAMITGIVLDELERRGLGTALVTLCAGNGLGTATIIERV
ncbi:MAG: acetyl-CoA C-acetyltransferase [Chelatococcus sp.]|uniref:acetyl-CoA C-acetyltransferase n=1 Tax=unclassified Chelatococcus TaxID=2638111 RepID=UPI001BCAE8A9|nr:MULTISPECIES: acetyl-CoA C-acetyltransferase [unclassified Chelatococcus]CAH1652877.1 3-ketoacyl-CoA thiolase [Hyphomicrobiales bacterium]MBS7742975.1 acetyl-CoA C-acetyltransferase [Chelatococcus sp. HY11]MBX3538913.1 acetyl-CoA C-acetyltransferase [Chelatococcus sp.]MBX3541907.1 acetyl-CoA C-acetyltransferase [Chelatococcus sp.]MCO5074202.1 acetyl-CoA C-acetyltransferase [Chelatococcus sp.]